jgi:hypothetical protein
MRASMAEEPKSHFDSRTPITAEASPATGNAGSPRSPSAEPALRLFGSVGLKVGLKTGWHAAPEC